MKARINDLEINKYHWFVWGNEQEEIVYEIEGGYNFYSWVLIDYYGI